MWRSVHARATVPEDLVERARQLPARLLLVLVEDWCGDAVNTAPVLARLAQAAPGLDLRILGREANPDLMDPHLYTGARAASWAGGARARSPSRPGSAPRGRRSTRRPATAKSAAGTRGTGAAPRWRRSSASWSRRRSRPSDPTVRGRSGGNAG
ncbi:thioredoxin family protein [Longimicrobium sp.]|uniref:thioredoxin family protein n=1 Tax=Longimicrobium sp. TaxID=2029185 RepID=UPI0039C957DD